jgi:uncharacterized membrane protein HdeD (DUF308 family)
LPRPAAPFYAGVAIAPPPRHNQRERARLVDPSSIRASIRDMFDDGARAFGVGRRTTMASETLVHHIVRSWKWMALRGVCAVLFGVLTLMWPGTSLLVLTLLFGAYAFVDGIVALVVAFKIRGAGRPMWVLLFIGIAGILAGIGAIVFPGMTALVLLMFIAAWAAIIGVFQIAAAIRFRREIKNEFWLALSGVLSLLFGVVLFLRPGAGALAVIWLIGAYATLFGILLLALAFKLKSHGAHLGAPARQAVA